jgi:hypothetical protein
MKEVRHKAELEERTTMRLLVDTSGMTFLVAGEPEPLREHDSDRQRTDRNGAPLYVIRVVALAGTEAEILTVRLTGAAPKGMVQGMPVLRRTQRHAVVDGRPGRDHLPGGPRRAAGVGSPGELSTSDDDQPNGKTQSR